MNKEITFIIPTIGRDTLMNSINSLLNQTIKKWNALIIFDGIKSNIIDNKIKKDNRIKIIEIEKKGININQAGNVRNYGISLSNTYWIAFLDDDDIIANDYIEIFYKELELYKNIDLDIIIFRMIVDDRIIPKIETDDFYLCDVGISFIMKKSIYDFGISFTPDGAEDFLFLDKVRTNNYKMMISPYIKYFVRKNNININFMNKINNGNRVFINVMNPMITLFGYLLLSKYK